MIILDGKKLSKKIKDELKEEIEKLDNKPGLAVIQVGEDPASGVYIKTKEKASSYVGIEFSHYHFINSNDDEVINKIEELNKDDKVNGIIVQLPLPEEFNKELIINTINPSKDVDGLTKTSIGNLYSGAPSLLPCTPKGIMALLEEYEVPIKGKVAVIVGASNLVGKPVAELLLKNGATVIICNSKTVDLKAMTLQADILISAVGKKHLITDDMIKKDSVIVDVGVTKIDGKIYGDVDFDNVSKYCQYISPCIGGVGPMTVAMLLENTFDAYRKEKY